MFNCILERQFSVRRCLRAAQATTCRARESFSPLMGRRLWKPSTLPSLPSEACCSPARPQILPPACLGISAQCCPSVLCGCPRLLCLGCGGRLWHRLCAHNRRGWHVGPSIVPCVHTPPCRLRDGGVPPHNLKRYTIQGKKASCAVHCTARQLPGWNAAYWSWYFQKHPSPRGRGRAFRLGPTGENSSDASQRLRFVLLYPVPSAPAIWPMQEGMHGAPLSCSAAAACTGPALCR